MLVSDRRQYPYYSIGTRHISDRRNSNIFYRIMFHCDRRNNPTCSIGFKHIPIEEIRIYSIGKCLIPIEEVLLLFYRNEHISDRKNWAIFYRIIFESDRRSWIIFSIAMKHISDRINSSFSFGSHYGQ